jgi:hypothetical protein
MAWSYPVLDPVSQAYPKVQGRSPTCYSPVRHSSTPERAFPFDLHVLSTPPAFVLSQDQTLQTKPVQKNPENISSKTDIKKQPHPQHGKPRAWQNNNKQNTKHTIEFSNNTPGFQATSPVYFSARATSSPTVQMAPDEVHPRGFPGSAPAAAGRLPVYGTRSISAPRPARISTNSG